MSSGHSLYLAHEMQEIQARELENRALLLEMKNGSKPMPWKDFEKDYNEHHKPGGASMLVGAALGGAAGVVAGTLAGAAIGAYSVGEINTTQALDQVTDITMGSAAIGGGAGALGGTVLGHEVDLASYSTRHGALKAYEEYLNGLTPQTTMQATDITQSASLAQQRFR